MAFERDSLVLSLTNMLEFLETVTAEIDAKYNVDTVYLDSTQV